MIALISSQFTHYVDNVPHCRQCVPTHYYKVYINIVRHALLDNNILLKTLFPIVKLFP